MKTLAAIFLLALALSAGAADYGVKTRFQQGKTLTFPDCQLVFTGTRHVASDVYPRGFLNYDFKVKSGGKTKDVSWSPGTGLVVPRFFKVNGKDFALELKGSAAFKGWMKEDELVLWKKADFDKIKQ
jgi:hypothetical protein